MGGEVFAARCLIPALALGPLGGCPFRRWSCSPLLLQNIGRTWKWPTFLILFTCRCPEPRQVLSPKSVASIFVSGSFLQMGVEIPTPCCGVPPSLPPRTGNGFVPFQTGLVSSHRLDVFFYFSRKRFFASVVFRRQVIFFAPTAQVGLDGVPFEAGTSSFYELGFRRTEFSLAKCLRIFDDVRGLTGGCPCSFFGSVCKDVPICALLRQHLGPPRGVPSKNRAFTQTMFWTIFRGF